MELGRVCEKFVRCQILNIGETHFCGLFPRVRSNKQYVPISQLLILVLRGVTEYIYTADGSQVSQTQVIRISTSNDETFPIEKCGFKNL